MINLITQAVTAALPENNITFIRDDEKSTQFNPVFQICVDEKPAILFNTAIINKIEKPISEVVMSIINGIVAQLVQRISPPTP
jgi:hypothetical protein